MGPAFGDNTKSVTILLVLEIIIQTELIIILAKKQTNNVDN